MAACGSLEHIFEKPLPENPTLLESLSPWKHIKSMKTPQKIDDSSFTELFGELHFKEQPSSSSSSPSSSSLSSWTDRDPIRTGTDIPKKDGISTVHDHDDKKTNSSSSYICPKRQYRRSDSFSSMNSESLSLCTEGLGFESFDDVEDLLKNDLLQMQDQGRKSSSGNNIHTDQSHCVSTDSRKLLGAGTSGRSSSGGFPPPISCIRKSGKPWVCFKSYRQDGRFILKEIRIPTQEFLHACREDGRLKLQFIQSDDEILEEDEDEEEEDDDDDENEDQNVEINRDFINVGNS